MLRRLLLTLITSGRSCWRRSNAPLLLTLPIYTDSLASGCRTGVGAQPPASARPTRSGGLPVRAISVQYTQQLGRPQPAS
ncbi:hypothetical protein [Candidatus Amarolinea dominans]|uniref:hypothetical protein n=1 Tax=Candidatus Amarolinea dominans TaxID=3140696 RepID=UPI001D7C1338|nr:hypothetical protein [Anaerolineae bacterium]